MPPVLHLFFISNEPHSARCIRTNPLPLALPTSASASTALSWDGRQNKRGTFLLSPPRVRRAQAQAQAFGLAHPFVSRRNRREERGWSRRSSPAVPSCGATPQTNPPKAVVCVGETPDFTELRVCWCPVGLRSGIPPLSSLLSFFGLRLLLCIPTLPFPIFPLRQQLANKVNPLPPRIAPCRAGSESTQRQRDSWFPWPPHCTALHRIIIITHRHRHTDTGTRRTTAGWAKLCVCPACLSLSGISPSHHWEGEFDGCCPARIIVNPPNRDLSLQPLGCVDECWFDPGPFPGRWLLRSSTSRPRRGSGEERGCGVSRGGGHDTAAISSYFLLVCYGRAKAVRRGMTGPRDSGRVTD